MGYTSTIESGRVSSAGADLMATTPKMYNALNTISGLISGSASCFDSAAGAQLRSQFQQTAAQFETFRSFLNQYGEFLETHASNVNAFEAAVEEGLGQIPKL